MQEFELRPFYGKNIKNMPIFDSKTARFDWDPCYKRETREEDKYDQEVEEEVLKQVKQVQEML